MDDTQNQKRFRVVETGMPGSKGKVLGGREITPPFLTKEEAEAYAESWRKAGRECGVITVDERGTPPLGFVSAGGYLRRD